MLKCVLCERKFMLFVTINHTKRWLKSVKLQVLIDPLKAIKCKPTHYATLISIAATSIKKCKNEDKKCLATVMTEIIKRAGNTGKLAQKMN